MLKYVTESEESEAEAVGGLVNQNQLMEWSGYRQKLRLMRWLMEVKIPYVLAAGGRIVTTTAAINAALLGKPEVWERETIEFADADDLEDEALVRREAFYKEIGYVGRPGARKQPSRSRRKG